MFSIKVLFLLTLLTFAAVPAFGQEKSIDNDSNGKNKNVGDGIEIHQEVTHANIHKKEEAKSPAESMFYMMDTNHDSAISLDEFVSNYSKLKSKGSGIGGGDAKSGFWKGFSSSTMMIIATEIGDKTFFIAAVLSMRNSRIVVFGGAISALICMTILSTMMGLVLPSFLPKQYTHVIGGILFLYFGIKLIYDSRSMSDKVSDELEEVEEELLERNKKDDIEVGGSNTTNFASKQSSSSSHKMFLQSFLLTFLAEWGDRSQIATIALAAAKNPYGVMIGGCLGHSLCTGMAVIGGRILASKISEKSVSFWGGFIFLGFAIHSLFFDSAE